ncbi:hypothetical protein BGX34_012127 [Mortierella sp. NVP85]|nr:hypothetical protein BGX34_012127 [Mortierella sp. NVP85]
MLEFHIDFQGQRLADHLTQGLISAFGVVGFLVGFLLQDIRLSLYIFVAGTVLTSVLVIPAWPYFKKNSVRWLPSRAKAAAAVAEASKQHEASTAGGSKEKSG